MGSPNSRTFHLPHRTLGMRLFNAIGRQLNRWGWGGQLTLRRVLGGARWWTKLSDWGDDRFQEPLQILLESLENEAHLTPLGRLLAGLSCARYAANRLRVRHFLQLFPQISAEQVRRPVFVVGLPRTGTTLLHHLLCQDSAVRPLRLWESLQPAPDADVLRGKPDRRRKRARRFVQLMNRWAAPQLRVVHPLAADGPEECTHLLLNTFVSPAFLLFGNCTGYLHWLRDCGSEWLNWCYKQYRLYLQLLQWQNPHGRWVLKSPAHAFGLQALLEQFPDACIIRTHRDMKQVIPSACSLFAISQGILSDEVDCRRLGPEAVRVFRTHLVEPSERIRGFDPARVFDVHYRSLISDPVGTVRAIHDHFGLEGDERREEAMHRWLARNPANKHGRHRYDLAQFGLTPADVDRQFGANQEAAGPAEEMAGIAANPPPQYR